MEMKGMMFAAGGLALAMTATTIMMSGDVTRMREQEQASRAKECAAMAAAAPADPAVAGAVEDISAASAETSPEGDAAKGCPAPTGAADARAPATTDEAMVDPATGMPYEGTDGTSTDEFGATYEAGGEAGYVEPTDPESAYAQEDPSAYDDGSSYSGDAAPTTDSDSYADGAEPAATAGF